MWTNSRFGFNLSAVTTRRKFITTTGSTMAAASIAPAADGDEDTPLLSFGLIADCQYANVDPAGARFYRNSAAKLDQAVSQLNRHGLKFSLHLGDFIDRDFRSFSELKPIVTKLKSRLYHALGNHDFDVEDTLKSKVPAELGLTTTYYAFRHKGFRFLVLDTTEVSTYRYPRKDAATVRAQKELRALAAAGKTYAQSWNGRVSNGQLLWLTGHLEKATEAGESVIIFGHHPILPEEAHCTWNCEALHKLLSRFPCCKAYLNGHRHTGGYQVSNGMHYLTLHGMLNTQDNAFSIARLYQSRLEIQGFGRQPSLKLTFR